MTKGSLLDGRVVICQPVFRCSANEIECIVPRVFLLCEQTRTHTRA